MSSQDKLEQVLRQMHVLIAEGKNHEGSPDEIIINKRVMLEQLNRLSVVIYEIMDEYEMTKLGRERAEREMLKKRNDIMNRADIQAEDVYAASILYANETLEKVQYIIQETMESFEAASRRVKDKLDDEKNKVRSNQSELQGNLIDLKDSGKYLQIIEDTNRNLERKHSSEKYGERESSNSVKPEIRINPKYFERIGVPLDSIDVDGVPGNSALIQYSTAEDEFAVRINENENSPKKETPEVRVNQNAEYFKRKKQ